MKQLENTMESNAMMTLKEAKELAKDNPYCALARVRGLMNDNGGDNGFFPILDAFGTPAKDAKWIFLDMAEKIDTGIYGVVYYLTEEE